MTLLAACQLKSFLVLAAIFLLVKCFTGESFWPCVLWPSFGIVHISIYIIKFYFADIGKYYKWREEIFPNTNNLVTLFFDTNLSEFLFITTTWQSVVCISFINRESPAATLVIQFYENILASGQFIEISYHTWSL